MKIKRILCAVLASLMLSSYLTACTTGGGNNVNTSADAPFYATTAEQIFDTETECVTEMQPTKIDLKETDAQLDVWYNHSFNKTPTNKNPTEIRSAGTEDYTVYMAKNEYENAQLYLYAPAGIKGISVELSGMNDRYGNSLPTDIYRV